MRVSILSLLVGSVTAGAVLPAAEYREHTNPPRNQVDLKHPSSSGFKDATFHKSNGGHATCVSGYVPVKASTNNNIKLDLSLPKNQSEVTEFFIAAYSAGSTVAQDIALGNATVSGTWNIYATLCTPEQNVKPKGVQLLTHGVGVSLYHLESYGISKKVADVRQFSNTYWDFAPNYSYVDVAAEFGYASFFYDRLGVGKSDKPDPIKTIQGPLEVEIAQVLATSLRKGKFSDNKFQKVLGAGHSFGSIITNAITKQYPDTFDAAILTGFSTDLSSQPLFLQALNLALANENQPARFSKLNNGFLVSSTAISNQIGFFKAPGFDPTILEQAEATKGTVTFGELNSLGGLGGLASNYTRPVAVINGVNDLPFCGGNCTYPSDQAKKVQPKYYPNVADEDFGSYLAPIAGHGLNFHYSAAGAYEYIQKFLVDRGLGLQ